jgi:hypothetical protein
MVKHDSLDKAPLNDEALSRQQKFYGGSRFTSKCTFHHVPEHRSFQVITQQMQACYAIKLLWVTVCYTPITSNCFHIEM